LKAFPVSRRLIAFALSVSLAAVLLVCGCATKDGRQVESSAPATSELSNTSSATTSPVVVDANLLSELPTIPGAMRVNRSPKELKYVLPGDQDIKMRAFYERELLKRGWRRSDQAGAGTIYGQGGAKVMVLGDWMNNGDLLVIVSR
jgi:hypothetical protein